MMKSIEVGFNTFEAFSAHSDAIEEEEDEAVVQKPTESWIVFPRNLHWSAYEEIWVEVEDEDY